MGREEWTHSDKSTAKNIEEQNYRVEIAEMIRFLWQHAKIYLEKWAILT